VKEQNKTMVEESGIVWEWALLIKSRYSNNELLILSTRKQILTRFFYSKNYDIYDRSTKICSTE
jgi:hypothetical protein